MAVAMVALDAVVRVLGPNGERTIPLTSFHRLPGNEPQRDTVLVERVHLEIGDSLLPRVSLAGGSMGTASWETAIIEAVRKLRERLQEVHGVIPVEGLEATGEGFMKDMILQIEI